MHFSPAALEVLMRYPWPGNIRELRNIVERCALLSPGSAIRPEGMPSEVLDALLLPKRTASQRTGKTGEQLMIEKALLEANGTRTAAARAIGWPRSKLYRRLQFYRIPAGFGRS